MSPSGHPGRNNLLLITGRFSRLLRTVPLKKITACSVAEAFARHWVLVYGPQVNLLSDHGPQFVAHVFQDVCQLLNVMNFLTITYQSQYNGTLLSALRAYSVEKPRTWDNFTDIITYAYNTEVQRGTGSPPFKPVLTRSPPPVALESQFLLYKLPSTTDLYTHWKN